MRPGHLPALLAALLAACVLAGAAAASAPAPGGEEIVPAPPPASTCRVAPDAGFPAFADALVAPDLSGLQDYRDALGFTPEHRGLGVTIADVEYEWRAGHAELAPRKLAAAATTGMLFDYRDHGTAVLALLGGAEDGMGVSGLVPEAELVMHQPVLPRAAYAPWDTITAAAKDLGPGDVLLIELQAGLGRDGSWPFVPIEHYDLARSAIRAAVDRGIVVVEPAGNGAVDLAALPDPYPTRPWLASATHKDHSGAIIVGAGGAGRDQTGTEDLRRVPVSNHGARVDLQGFGAGVVTAGYGDAPWSASGDLAYTACFDGTSSAAATIAAAAAAVQSAEIARDGTPLTPAEVRDLLVATGTPQVSAGVDGLIGPRPDVAAAIAALPALGVMPKPPTAVTPIPVAPAPSAPATPGDPAPQPAPPAAPAAPVAPAAPAARTATTPAAASGLAARLDRRAGRLTLRLSRLAPRAVVRVAGRRVAVRGGRAVVRLSARTLVVRVTAPARAGVRPRAVSYRVIIPARGAPRVLRLR
ncbi:MAG: S8 family serine peptidase [Thermoleophilia bacterium]